MLPDELWAVIFFHTSDRDLLSLSKVNRRFRSLVCLPQVWRKQTLSLHYKSGRAKFCDRNLSVQNLSLGLSDYLKFATVWNLWLSIEDDSAAAKELPLQIMCELWRNCHKFKLRALSYNEIQSLNGFFCWLMMNGTERLETLHLNFDANGGPLQKFITTIPVRTLQELNVTNFTDDPSQLLQLIAQFPNITSLHLSNSTCTSIAIGNIFDHCTSLTKLSLSKLKGPVLSDLLVLNENVKLRLLEFAYESDSPSFTDDLPLIGSVLTTFEACVCFKLMLNNINYESQQIQKQIDNFVAFVKNTKRSIQLLLSFGNTSVDSILSAVVEYQADVYIESKLVVVRQGTSILKIEWHEKDNQDINIDEDVDGDDDNILPGYGS